MRIFRVDTVFKRLLFPVMSIMIVQGLLYIIVFFQGGIVQHAEQNTFAALEGQVANRHIYMQNEMIQRWGNITEGEGLILDDIRGVLTARVLGSADISRDTALNEELLEAALPNLIYMLRKNIVTGAFLILDGPALNDDESSRAGVYVRDLDPINNYSSGNKDLLLERGLPRLSKRYELSLDSYWESCFQFSDGDAPHEAYFHEPLRAARAAVDTVSDSADFGYWSMPFRLGERDIEVISYSRPLILDGEVIGVIGVDITLSYLQSMLKYADLAADNSGAYYLGVTSGSGDISRVCINGPVFRAHFREATVIAARQSEHDGILSITAPDGTVFYAVPQYFRLYNPNAPFEDQQWVLLGMTRRDDILSYSDNIRRLVYLSTLISLAIGIMGIMIASGLVSRPIRRLAANLQKADPKKPIVLRKLNISEIDLLTVSIEQLSRAVADSASKLTKIIEMLNLPVGVYECNKQSGQVFCSKRWFEYVRGDRDEHDSYIPREEFDRAFEELEQFRADSGDWVYMLPGPDGPVWLRRDQREHGNLTLGVLSDITKDMNEKLKIEFERDYDVLTSLYNRRAFEQRMDELFHDPDALNVAALIMWDLDNLKYINDTYGHTVGDEYICAFANALRGFDPGRSVAARRSGDEFYVFLYGYDSREEIDERIRATWEGLQRSSWKLPDGSNMRIRVSAGVAWYPTDANTIDELVRYADFAMYNVKHTSKGRIKEFNMQTYRQNSVLVNGTEAINQLIEQRLIHYAMQPIIDARVGTVYGYEMLMRSDMKELPGVSDVLRLASAQSKLDAIEELTFFMGMKTYKTFVESGDIMRGSKVFLNSIGGQMMPPELQRRFERAFAEYIQDIVVEITETQYTTEDGIMKKVGVVREWGAKLALDDFGSGYNTETSLIRFAPSIVKVDISIVAGIDRDIDQQSLFRNLVSYARPRGIGVLAEGVEREDELRMLFELGVDYVQGYLFARPTAQPAPPSESAMRLLRELIARRTGGQPV